MDNKIKSIFVGGIRSDKYEVSCVHNFVKDGVARFAIFGEFKKPYINRDDIAFYNDDGELISLFPARHIYKIVYFTKAEKKKYNI